MKLTLRLGILVIFSPHRLNREHKVHIDRLGHVEVDELRSIRNVRLTEWAGAVGFVFYQSLGL